MKNVLNGCYSSIASLDLSLISLKVKTVDTVDFKPHTWIQPSEEMADHRVYILEVSYLVNSRNTFIV